MANINKSMKTAADELGFSYDAAKAIACGYVNGFTAYAVYTPSTYLITAVFSVCRGDGIPAEAGILSGCELPKKAKVNAPGFRIEISLPLKGSTKNMAEDIAGAVRTASERLAASGCVNCDALGLAGDTGIYLFKGAYTFLNDASASRAESELAAEAEDEAQKNENYILGTVGALIGSLIGAAVILLFGRLGRVSILSGIAMGLAVVYGYKKLGGKIGKAGNVICVIVSFLMTYLAFRTDTALDLYLSFDEELKSIFSFSDCMIYSKDIFALADSLDTYYTNLALMLLFGVGGALATVVSDSIKRRDYKKLFRIY